MYTELQIGNETYKLRLTTRGLVDLEERLGYNPLQMFMQIDADILPKVKDIATLLHASMQSLQHGITLDRVYDLLDEYLAEHTLWDIIPVLMDVFKECGFIERDEAEAPKN